MCIVICTLLLSRPARGAWVEILKLNSKVPFKQPEISKACSLLEIGDSDIPAYFFTIEVQ